ncbi:hypothetical protein GGR57DRAFT_454163 [Xylariaceae sp. FL1272]|nr:hypothetical protein GGR57DRAFT_454163 [Xylariaceae sp. FL1272]
MNISRIDGSRYGAVLLSQPSTATTTALSRATRPRRSFIAHGLPIFPAPASGPSAPWLSAQKARRNLPRSRNFCTAVAPTSSPIPSSNYFTSHIPTARSWNHTAVVPNEPSSQTRTSDASRFGEREIVVQRKADVLDFVDQYDDEINVDAHFSFYKDPYRRGYAQSDGPVLAVSHRKEDLEIQAIDGDRENWQERFKPGERLRRALDRRQRQRHKVSLDKIWELYQELPEPKITHISPRVRHQLMATLGSVERKDQTSMLRYFAAVADIKNSGFSLAHFEWNTAVSFASRYVAVTTETEVGAALQLWREMEKTSNVKATDVTFNILFDAASKAGKFDLGEAIYQEMGNRGFVYNRYHHVSLIHFFGLKKDSAGVRAAYREMIHKGEIIDTVVLNCVIAGFIRCGEEASAERVYEKMKAANQDLPTIPHRNYSLQKAMTKTLMMFARIGNEHPTMRTQFQKTALLSPDLRTYRILINHYGLKLGDLSKVAQYLDEMKHYKVSIHGSIFLALFKSFAQHGGPGSDWSQQRLNGVWDAFLDAVDSEADGLHISTWLAMAALQAHAKYASKNDMLDVYECLRSRWDLDAANSQFMLNFLHKILTKTDSPTGSWRKSIVM